MDEPRTHRTIPARCFLRRLAHHAAIAGALAGLAFLAVAGLTLAPFAHRLLHEFHWDADAD